MNQKIIYITFQTPTNEEDVIFRTNLAQKSVDKENLLYNNWVINRNFELKRNATLIGDGPLPFVRDMIEFGMSLASENDIVVLSNADICLIPKITERIIDLCNKFGSLYSHRYDFKNLTELIETEEKLNEGEKYIGYDLFAFLKKWWCIHENEFPDMVLGREAWDMIYHRAIKENGGAELDKAIYHQIHNSPWSTFRELKGNIHNLNLAYNWISIHGGNISGKD